MNTRWPATVKDKKTTRQTSAALPVAFFVEVQAAAAKSLTELMRRLSNPDAVLDLVVPDSERSTGGAPRCRGRRDGSRALVTGLTAPS